MSTLHRCRLSAFQAHRYRTALRLACRSKSAYARPLALRKPYSLTLLLHTESQADLVADAGDRLLDNDTEVTQESAFSKSPVCIVTSVRTNLALSETELRLWRQDKGYRHQLGYHACNYCTTLNSCNLALHYTTPENCSIESQGVIMAQKGLKG
eukprot:IDg12972t1